MKIALVGVILIAPLLLIGMASCGGGGMTQEQIDAKVKWAGDLAAAKAEEKTRAEMAKMLEKLTAAEKKAIEAIADETERAKTLAELAAKNHELAKQAGEQAAALAKIAAEDAAKKLLEPLKEKAPSTNGGGLLGLLTTVLTTVGMSFIEAKSRSW